MFNNPYFYGNQQQFKGYSIIPVTNEQEARAAQIDIMNGIPSFFYNQNQGEIYLKQINQYGKADFIRFSKQSMPTIEEQKPINNDVLAELNKKIDGLYALFETKEETKGGKNAK